jgi:hypothetical protein
MDIREFQKDIEAFADDANEVLIDPNGSTLFSRHGKEVSIRLLRDDMGDFRIESQDRIYTYREYLRHELGGLDTFAQRIIARRPSIYPFVRGTARLDSASSETEDGDAMAMLRTQCENPDPFSSRVVFLTADAGHGKTALLRQFQREQADLFIKNRSGFLFWHVDLQGRQLLRLSEALMGDLGDLRISGLWMPAIITLIRQKLLVLAIDGFDELAAEQGSADALGALSVLVNQMEASGTIVAASRRSFFDTEDYVKRVGLIKRGVSTFCEVNQIHLRDWSKVEVCQYFGSYEYEGNKLENPESVYDALVQELESDKHPMISRPFLVSHIAKALLRYKIDVHTFLHASGDPMRGVAAVIEAFIKREVQEKWKFKDTGQPYLTVDQHMQFLENVAEEMWSSQTDRLSVELVEALASVLLEDWNIELSQRRQIIDMVKMHVLLAIPAEGDAHSRCFDHLEFRHYFLARVLCKLLTEALAGKGYPLRTLLSVSPLPDSVANYVSLGLDLTLDKCQALIVVLCDLVAKEWRPSSINTNLGTILPYIINGKQFDDIVSISGKLIYPSLVFEHTNLHNVTFSNSSFVHCSFSEVDWHNVRFENCELVEVAFDQESTYKEVLFKDCTFSGVKLLKSSDDARREEVYREYAPVRIIQMLDNLGITVTDGAEVLPAEEQERHSQKRKALQRFLRIFRRTTGINDSLVHMKCRTDEWIIMNEIIPLMKAHGLLTEETWSGRGQQQRFVLQVAAEDLLRADDGSDSSIHARFWREIDS